MNATMMRVAFLTFCLTPLTAMEVSAQYQPNPGYRPLPPPVSPYLNLVRPGTSPAINYYGIVRPVLDFRNSIQSLQQDVATYSAEATTQTAATGVPTTGHAVHFDNFSHFYAGPGGRTTAPAATGQSNRFSATPTPIKTGK